MRDVRELLGTFDASLPLERARTLPSAAYTATEVHRAEQDRIFAAGWQVVARADELVEPGSFVTTEIAGEPIVVTRNESGALCGFSNVCRHRGARVVPQACGRAQRLRCHYHGWTYDLDGKLRGVPEFDGVEEFAREDNGLPPVQVATWGPLVFACLDRNVAPLATFLDPMPARLAPFQIEANRFHSRRSYELPCNWKVYVDNYLDGGYHVNTIHPALAGVIDYSKYRTELFRWNSVQVSPLRPADKIKNAETAFVRTGTEAQYWWIFPNLMVNAYDGLMDVNIVIPLGPERCRVLFDFYFAERADRDASFMEKSIEVAHQVQVEDMGVCDEVQAGLNSRTYDTGRFSARREGGGYHFHRMVAEQLLAPSPR